MIVPMRSPATAPATAPMTISVSGSVTPFDAGDAGRIGAGAEQRGLAERRDAAIAGDEIERQRRAAQRR